jgi:hypothetical protein
MAFRDADDQYQILALEHALYDRSVAGMAKLPVTAYAGRAARGLPCPTVSLGVSHPDRCFLILPVF